MIPTSSSAPQAGAAEFPLTADQPEHFRLHGHLVIEDFLSEHEIASIEDTYDRFIRGEVSEMARDLCDMSGSYDRPFESFDLVNAVLPRKYEPGLQGNIFERRAESVGRQLLGEDATLDYDPFLAKRPRRDAAVFAWHQDLGYWPTGTPDTRTTTCSLALDDADLSNGCLRVVPGSHREPELRAHRPAIRTSAEGIREESHTLTIALLDSDEIAHLPVPRGGITVHDERIIHGSGGNPSDRWRRTDVVAHRSRATVEYELSIGFTHSHNDEIQWETHLDALRAKD